MEEGYHEAEDVGDLDQLRAEVQAYELERAKEFEAIRLVMKTKTGRSFIWRLMTECKLYEAAPDKRRTRDRCDGKRDIGLWIMNELDDADPKLYSKMRDEQSVSREPKVRREVDG